MTQSIKKKKGVKMTKEKLEMEKMLNEVFQKVFGTKWGA